MKAFLTGLAAALLLTGCTPATTSTGVGSTVPGVSVVCNALSDTAKFDTALKAYDAATDAINLLIDVKVIKPGSPSALKIAAANDAALAGFAAAEHARAACNSADYLSALANVGAAIADIRAALPNRQ